MKISICNLWSINNAGRHGLNRLYTKYYRLTTNWPSTSVENALQIAPFMQNEANFQKSQMNVNPYNTTDYENISDWTLGENEPNTNPIRTQTKPIKANFRKSQNECKLTYNKGLQKKRRFRSPKKQTQFKANFQKAKMNINKVLTKDYENEPLFRRGKNKPNSNPNKPNFKRYLAKMGHHELKYIDRLGQLTLNLFIKVNTQASSAERT